MSKTDTSNTRYNSVAIVLHWAMAIGFILMLGSGLAMEWLDLDKQLVFKMYQWHKGGGVLLLLAFAARIFWRFFTTAPSMPKSFSKLDITLAKLGHIALYGMMIIMPITGWVMVSSSVYGLPTIVFDWFEWPHIPGLQGNEAVESTAKTSHMLLAYAFIGLILVHIAAVVKHAVKDDENLLTRMWWGMKKAPAKLLGFSFVLGLFIASPALAGDYTIDYDESKVEFSGQHAGADFTGVFEDWQGTIYFDKANPESSVFKATFQLKSAVTGNKMYDGTLPQSDWFNVQETPEAAFTSARIVPKENGTYEVTGDLTLKEITEPVTFEFTLEEQEDGSSKATAEFDVNRLSYNIGVKSDPSAEWVSELITIRLNVSAQALPAN